MSNNIVSNVTKCRITKCRMLQSVECNKVSNATKCRITKCRIWYLKRYFSSIHSLKMVMMLFIIYTRTKTVTPPLPATLIYNFILLYFLGYNFDMYIKTIDKLELIAFKHRYIVNFISHSLQWTCNLLQHQL